VDENCLTKMNTAQLKQEKTPLPKEKCLNKTLCYKITSYDIIVAEFPMGGKIIPQNKTFFLLVFLLLSLSHFPNCVSLMPGSPSHPF